MNQDSIARQLEPLRDKRVQMNKSLEALDPLDTLFAEWERQVTDCYTASAAFAATRDPAELSTRADRARQAGQPVPARRYDQADDVLWADSDPDGNARGAFAIVCLLPPGEHR